MLEKQSGKFDRFIIAALLLMAQGLTLASAEQPVWIEPMFGPEFTFTNDELINASNRIGTNWIDTPENRKVQLAWRDLMEKRCAENKTCSVIERRNSHGLKVFQITYTDGFHYTVSLDPHVVELQMKPMTIPETVANRDRIQRDIFEVAQELGLSAHDYYGGGSIHIDKKSGFENDPMLFLDFFIDYSNHYTLSTRCMGQYFDNAPPVLGLPEKNVAKLRQIIASARAKHAAKEAVRVSTQEDETSGKSAPSIGQIAEQIRTQVYSTTYYSQFRPTQKYQALNLDKMRFQDEKHHTVEVRGIRAQRSADEYINMMRIFRARINFLNMRRKHQLPDIPLLDQLTDQTQGTSLEDSVFYHREKVRSADQYRRYISQTGLGWDSFQNVIPQDLFCAPESSRFQGEDCIRKASPKIESPELLKDLLKIRSKL